MRIYKSWNVTCWSSELERGRGRGPGGGWGGTWQVRRLRTSQPSCRSSKVPEVLGSQLETGELLKHRVAPLSPPTAAVFAVSR